MLHQLLKLRSDEQRSSLAALLPALAAWRSSARPAAAADPVPIPPLGDPPGPMLSRQERPPLLTPFVAPSTPLERRIADAWQDTLGIDGVGVDDNFYALGGTSLFATRIVSWLKARFPVPMALDRFLTTPTVAAWAEATRDFVVTALSALPDAEAEQLLAALNETSTP